MKIGIAIAGALAAVIASGATSRVLAVQDAAEMPLTRTAIAEWATTDHITFVRDPDDRRSPRSYVGQTGPEFDAYDVDGVVADLVKDTGLRFETPPQLERIENWIKIAGANVWVGFVEADLGGAPGVVYLNVYQVSGSDQFVFNTLHLTKGDFAAMGGAPKMLVLEGLVPSMEVFDEAQLAELADAPLADHTVFFEMIADVIVRQATGEAVQSMAAMALQDQQLRLIQNMMEMNNNAIMGYEYNGELGQY